MAITWTEDPDSRVNLGFSTIQQCNNATFASSDYTTGGYTVNPNAFGLGRIRGVWEVSTVTPPLGVVWKFNRTTNKLAAYWSAGSATFLAEVANGTDLSTGGAVLFKAEGF